MLPGLITTTTADSIHQRHVFPMSAKPRSEGLIALVIGVQEPTRP